MPSRPDLPIRIGIRARVFGLVLAMGLPFLAYIALAATRQAERDHEHLRERARGSAALAAARLDDHVGDVSSFLRTLAVALPLSEHDAAPNDARLRSLVPSLPANLGRIELWSADGRNLGSSAGVAQPRRIDPALFDAALKDDALQVQAPVRLGDEWVAVFAMRLQPPSGAVVIATVTSGLVTLPRLLDPDGQFANGAVVTVIGRDARVVARSAEGERYVGSDSAVDPVVLLRRFASGEGDARFVGLDGRERILGYSRARRVPWLVYAGVPSEVALAPGLRERNRGVWVGIAMLVLGMAYAAWFARDVVRPLRQLAADALAIGVGDATHRTAVRHGSEVGLLGLTLNRMAAMLEDRMAAVRHEEKRLALALEGSAQALFDWDVRANLLHYDSRTASLRGEPCGVQVMPPEALTHHVHPDDLPLIQAALHDALLGRTALYEVEHRDRHADGRWVWIRSRGRVVERDAGGKALRLIGTDTDITQARAAADALRERAERDPLTGLPNRALFADRLASAISRARRSGRTLALLYLDVDRFKQVNDSLGHAAGDVLLRATATRLVGAVRQSDTVARLSGDEFTVVLESLHDRADAAEVGEKLVEAMRAPVAIGERSVSVSTSIGIAILEADDDAASLLARADDALYEAKRSGRDRYAVSRAVAG